MTDRDPIAIGDAAAAVVERAGRPPWHLTITDPYGIERKLVQDADGRWRGEIPSTDGLAEPIEYWLSAELVDEWCRASGIDGLRETIEAV